MSLQRCGLRSIKPDTTRAPKLARITLLRQAAIVRSTSQLLAKTTLNRRHLLMLGVLAALPVRRAVAAPNGPLVQVWKDPGCGCCKDWIAHLESNGFKTQVMDRPTDGARPRMPADYRSCHTARVEGYLVEGHVPARDIRRALKEKPSGIGLAAPGMPIGSPGMDGTVYGGKRDPYDVVLVLADGTSRVYQPYR